MKARGYVGAILAAAYLLLPGAGFAWAADLVSDAEVKGLGMQRYWQSRMPLVDNALVSRVALLDDALYVLTDTNLVYAVHAPSGVLRWSSLVAPEGQTIRGPTHSRQFVFFTTPGAVRLMNRYSGESASEPRHLQGVVIEVSHDTATVSVGETHGVRAGDILNVFRPSQGGDIEGEPIAKLQITSLDQRQARGRLTRLTSAARTTSGDVVRAEVALPLPEVKLPFAASSAAVADEERVYVGAANQRFYCLNILSGLQQWQLLSPKTVSATPLLDGEDLLFAGQEGLAICLTKGERTKNWSFETEGPIFADLVLYEQRVYAASTDRSLYALDRRSGRQIWRERFDTPLDEAPVLACGRLYQQVPQAGLYVLDAQTGKHLWRRAEGGRFLLAIDQDVYLLAQGAGSTLLGVDAETGKVKATADAKSVAHAVASQADQSILLADRLGNVLCLRSDKAPRFTPAQLTEALRNVRKMRLRTELDAQAKTAKAHPTSAPAEAKRPESLFEEDWLTSRSTAWPVGGHGVVKMEAAQKAGKEEKKSDKKEEKAKDQEGVGTEEEEAEEGAADQEAAEDEEDQEANDEEE